MEKKITHGVLESKTVFAMDFRIIKRFTCLPYYCYCGRPTQHRSFDVITKNVIVYANNNRMRKGIRL